MKKIFGAIALVLSTSAFAWDLGEQGYVNNSKMEFITGDVWAMISVEDIRGDKIRGKVRAIYWDSLSGHACWKRKDTRLQYVLDEYYWFNKSDIKSSW